LTHVELPELIAKAEAEAIDDTPLARVASASRLSIELSGLGDRIVDHFVDEARRAGCSWAQIGSVLGITRQAAQQRYGGLLRRLLPGESRRSPTVARFGPDARHAVVEAQAAARDLGHDHVDTEHLLLGLLADSPHPTAGAALLTRFEVSRDVTEEEIVSLVGRGRAATAGHIPFAPSAKKVLELSLRESIRLGHRHIGTEHLLLALLRERDGVAAQLLERHGVDRKRVFAALEQGVS
jgi:Clp amino terminal domain, pathogenicity island component